MTANATAATIHDCLLSIEWREDADCSDGFDCSMSFALPARPAGSCVCTPYSSPDATGHGKKLPRREQSLSSPDLVREAVVASYEPALTDDLGGLVELRGARQVADVAGVIMKAGFVLLGGRFDYVDITSTASRSPASFISAESTSAISSWPGNWATRTLP